MKWVDAPESLYNSEVSMALVLLTIKADSSASKIPSTSFKVSSSMCAASAVMFMYMEPASDGEVFAMARFAEGRGVSCFPFHQEGY